MNLVNECFVKVIGEVQSHRGAAYQEEVDRYTRWHAPFVHTAREELRGIVQKEAKNELRALRAVVPASENGGDQMVLLTPGTQNER